MSKFNPTKRKGNFTYAETGMLLNEIAKHKKLLMSPCITGPVKDWKRSLWFKISSKVNSVGDGTHRTSDEVRKKWSDMLCLARRKYLKGKKDLNPFEAQVLSIRSESLLHFEKDLTENLAFPNEEEDESFEFETVHIKQEKTDEELDNPPVYFDGENLDNEGSFEAQNDYPEIPIPYNPEVTSRKRKSNFSHLETEALFSEVKLHRSIIRRKGNDTCTLEKKRRAWETITEKVNSTGRGEYRTVEEVRKKWADMQSLKRRAKYKKKGTGQAVKVETNTDSENEMVDSFDGEELMDVECKEESSLCPEDNDIGNSSDQEFMARVLTSNFAEGEHGSENSKDDEMRQEEDTMEDMDDSNDSNCSEWTPGSKRKHSSSSTKLRKGNFTPEETKILLDEIYKRRKVIFSRNLSRRSAERKKKEWQRIAKLVSSTGQNPVRTYSEVRKKWSDLYTRASKFKVKVEQDNGQDWKVETDTERVNKRVLFILEQRDKEYEKEDEDFEGAPFPTQTQADWAAKEVVCEDHFEKWCFEPNLQAQLLGTKAKPRLKPEAYPTLVAHRKVTPVDTSRADRLQQRKNRMYVNQVLKQICPKKKQKRQNPKTQDSDSEEPDQDMKTNIKIETDRLSNISDMSDTPDDEDMDNILIMEVDEKNEDGKKKVVDIIKMKKETPSPTDSSFVIENVSTIDEQVFSSMGDPDAANSRAIDKKAIRRKADKDRKASDKVRNKEDDKQVMSWKRNKFTSREIFVLLEEILKTKHLLTAEDVEDDKRRMRWREITCIVNNVQPEVKRTCGDVKRKWYELMCNAKKKRAIQETITEKMKHGNYSSLNKGPTYNESGTQTDDRNSGEKCQGTELEDEMNENQDFASSSSLKDNLSSEKLWSNFQRIPNFMTAIDYKVLEITDENIVASEIDIASFAALDHSYLPRRLEDSPQPQQNSPQPQPDSPQPQLRIESVVCRADDFHFKKRKAKKAPGKNGNNPENQQSPSRVNSDSEETVSAISPLASDINRQRLRIDRQRLAVEKKRMNIEQEKLRLLRRLVKLEEERQPFLTLKTTSQDQITRTSSVLEFMKHD